jgi:peptide/nickel transport system permease protein
MLIVAARRLATAAATLLLITLVVFGMIHLAPGGPLEAGPEEEGFFRLGEAARAELRALYHLDEPLGRQYLLWLGDLLRADLGRSFHDRRPVTEKIGERMGITLTLNALSLALMLLVAVPLGTAGALSPGSIWDRLAEGGTFLLYAVPVFWAGLLLQILFAVHLDLLPLAGLRSSGHEFLGGAGRWIRCSLARAPSSKRIGPTRMCEPKSVSTWSVYSSPSHIP